MMTQLRFTLLFKRVSAGSLSINITFLTASEYIKGFVLALNSLPLKDRNAYFACIHRCMVQGAFAPVDRSLQEFVGHVGAFSRLPLGGPYKTPISLDPLAFLTYRNPLPSKNPALADFQTSYQLFANQVLGLNIKSTDIAPVNLKVAIDRFCLDGGVSEVYAISTFVYVSAHRAGETGKPVVTFPPTAAGLCILLALTQEFPAYRFKIIFQPGNPAGEPCCSEEVKPLIAKLLKAGHRVLIDAAYADTDPGCLKDLEPLIEQGLQLLISTSKGLGLSGLDPGVIIGKDVGTGDYLNIVTTCTSTPDLKILTSYLTHINENSVPYMLIQENRKVVFAQLKAKLKTAGFLALENPKCPPFFIIKKPDTMRDDCWKTILVKLGPLPMSNFQASWAYSLDPDFDKLLDGTYRLSVASISSVNDPTLAILYTILGIDKDPFGA